MGVKLRNTEAVGLFTVHPAFLHFWGSQTPAEGGYQELVQSVE